MDAIPPLAIGVITAHLQASGIAPMDTELLNNTDNGKDNSEANFLSKTGGNPSAPQDELVLSFRNTVATLSIVKTMSLRSASGGATRSKGGKSSSSIVHRLQK